MPDFQRLVIFDSETYETMNPAMRTELESEAWNAKPANSAPKAEKARWYEENVRRDRVAEALSDTALDVLLAEPLLVGFAGSDGRASALEIVHSVSMMGERPCGPESSEEFYAGQRTGLEVLREQLAQLVGPKTVIVGHNIEGYDLPVLCNAWRRHRIAPPEYFPRWKGRYWEGRVFDTMLRTPTRSGFVSLERACQAYGVQHNFNLQWRGEPVDGSKVSAMYRAGAFEELSDYGADDVRAAYKLYMAQTCGDTSGTWERLDEVGRQIGEIRSAPMGEDAKKLAIFGVMEAAGLVPRAA